ncbi:MAG: hypothetical protein QOF68_1065 [Gaiellales bacterium]|jgi:hypothetical protein|nr:hypothetical protein [Gaiellales bacterium]
MRYVVTVGAEHGILPGLYGSEGAALEAGRRVSGMLGSGLTAPDQIEVRIWEAGTTDPGDGIQLERIVACYRGGNRLS